MRLRRAGRASRGPLNADVRWRQETALPNSLSPWIEVTSVDGHVCVETSDEALFDFLDDYFVEQVGLVPDARFLEPTVTAPRRQQLLFDPSVPPETIEKALGVFSRAEIERIVKSNAP